MSQALALVVGGVVVLSVIAALKSKITNVWNLFIGHWLMFGNCPPAGRQVAWDLEI